MRKHNELTSSMEQPEQESRSKTNSFRRCKWELSGRISTRKRDWQWIRFLTNKMRFWTIARYYHANSWSRRFDSVLGKRYLSLSDWKLRWPVFISPSWFSMDPRYFRINGLPKFQACCNDFCFDATFQASDEIWHKIKYFHKKRFPILHCLCSIPLRIESSFIYS